MLLGLLSGALGLAAGALADGTLVRDVVIIGGGASGAYAAVRLREDFGKSVIVVEKEDRLGGHVDSFVDADSGVALDFGVKSFIDTGNATGFFDRLGIKRGRGSVPVVDTTYIDFDTGEVLDFTPPARDAQRDALRRFLDVVEPWEPLLQPGYFDFPAPHDIPGDLLIPFGDFLVKHGLEDAALAMYQINGLGLGNMVKETTMFVLQAYGASMARTALGLQGSFVPASGRNQDVYDVVADVLGDDVLYSSTVVSADRSDVGVRVAVRSSHTGRITTVAARRLLVAVEPTRQNTRPLDLDAEERQTLYKFRYTRRYAGVVDNAALVVNRSYFNLPADAAPHNYLSYPDVPFTARIDYLGEGHYFRVTLLGDDFLDADGARDLVQRDVDRLRDARVLGDDDGGVGGNGSVHWVRFADHGPMYARVSVDEVRDGFYQKLYALQGRRSTWWTGGAWSVNFQTTLWEYDDIIIPQMLAGLD